MSNVYTREQMVERTQQVLGKLQQENAGAPVQEEVFTLLIGMVHTYDAVSLERDAAMRTLAYMRTSLDAYLDAADERLDDELGSDPDTCRAWQEA